MCGIYLTNRKFEETEVENKLNLIRYRGPDNSGILKISDVILGHLRLAILDLDERSNQPMHLNELSIVYNGEIYNFLSLKEQLIELGHQFITTSDTEVLLHGYKQWGEKVLQKLNGMFAFAIYDSLNQKLFCARDRLGVKPFYYYWKDGELEICSQIRPLINKESEVSEEAISIYLDCGYIPSPFSIIKNIYKLRPGNYMEIDLQKLTKTEKEYWNLKTVELKELSYEEAKKHLHDLLIDAVKIRLRSDVPIGTFLSGGIDSALVSAIASRISTEPINTFTIGFHDAKYDESKVAEQFAKVIGSIHKETICTPEDIVKLIPKLVDVYDEPFADSSALPSLLLNSITKKYVTVALSGDGGDESFLGYNHFDSVAKVARIARIPKKIRYWLSKFVGISLFRFWGQRLQNVLKIKKVEDFITAIFIGYDSLQKKRNTRWLKEYQNYLNLSVNPIQRAADLNIKLWLENDSNVKVDRASMAYSVEIRSPFLDYRIIDFARTIPVSFRYKAGTRKKILKDILSEYIPKEIFNLPKKGFAIPIGKWMRKDLKEQLITTLSEGFLNTVPNLDTLRFKRLFQQHLEGKKDNSFSIWKLFVLAKWYQEFGFYSNLAEANNEQHK